MFSLFCIAGEELLTTHLGDVMEEMEEAEQEQKRIEERAKKEKEEQERREVTYTLDITER